MPAFSLVVGGKSVAEVYRTTGGSASSSDGDEPERSVFTWEPCGINTDPRCFELRDPNLSVGGVTDPLNLSTSILCGDGPCEKTWPEQPEAFYKFEITVNGFGKGAVRSDLIFVERVRVVGVPEPSTFALLLSATIGLIVLSSRARQSGRPVS